MHGNLPRLPEYGGRGVEVARLVRVGHENSVLRPHEIPAARASGPGESPENEVSRAAFRPVKTGIIGETEIEIVSGLNPGDQVILSDTSAWDSHERIRLN